MKKKILLDDNRDKAESLIDQIEKVYLSRVSTLIFKLKELGITEITKDSILEAIDRNLQPFLGRYMQLCRADIEMYSTPEMRSQTESYFQTKFDKVRKAVEAFYCLEVSEKLPFSFSVLAGTWELDDSDRPYIPEERKTVIIEGFKEYLQDDELIRVYMLHAETAKKMQELVNLVRSSGLASSNLLFQSGLFAINGLFLFEDNLEPWLISIKPRPLDYKGELKALKDEIDDGGNKVEQVEAFSRKSETPWYQ